MLRLNKHEQSSRLREALSDVPAFILLDYTGITVSEATALRNAQGSMARSQAVIESYAILDAIRAAVPAAAVNNPAQKAAATTAYTLARTCSPPPAGATLASNDLNLWIATMQTTLGAGSCGTVTCAANVCTVTVEWDETRSTGGAADYSIKTVSQI